MKDELAKAFEAGRRAERAEAVEYLKTRAEFYKDSYCYSPDVYEIASDLALDVEYGNHLPPELGDQVAAEMEEKERKEQEALRKEQEALKKEREDEERRGREALKKLALFYFGKEGEGR
jgi:hypothetical protein